MSQEHTNIWTSCLKFLKDNVSSIAFKTWFEPIVPVKLEKKVLTIQVPSHYVYEWLEEHYITLLRAVIKKELGVGGRLEYTVVMENSQSGSSPYTMKIPSTNTPHLKNTPVSIPRSVEDKQIRNPFVIPGLKKINIASNLNPSYSFDNFIEGDCNRLARASGYAVSKKPGGTAFNPLLIYGGVGLGKTHLAHAIGIEIKNRFPNKIVLYVGAEKFSQQFIDAITNHTINDFVHFYQMIDVLLLDDVQFFAKKEKTQDVFFNIFNELHQKGKQIILTSDKPPVELQGMEQRLLSRFKWGLSADLSLPDYETRIAILERKMYGSGIELPKDITEYLAYAINTNVREMEGALNTLIAQASLNKKAITIELARQMVDKFVKNIAKEVSIEYIQKVVCDHFSISIDQLKSASRKRELVQARQITMHLAKKLTPFSLAIIGMSCGGRDHATVLHACRTVANLYETNKVFKQHLDDIEKTIAIGR